MLFIRYAVRILSCCLHRNYQEYIFNNFFVRVKKLLLCLYRSYQAYYAYATKAHEGFNEFVQIQNCNLHVILVETIHIQLLAELVSFERFE